MITARMSKAKVWSARIPEEYAGRRLDRALAGLFPHVTRSQLQQWIDAGRVSLDRRAPRKRDKVAGGEIVEIEPPPPREAVWTAQAILMLLALDQHTHLQTVLVVMGLANQGCGVVAR